MKGRFVQRRWWESGVCRTRFATSLEIPPHIARDRTALDLLLACASKTDWHSYVKPPFGGPEQVLAYLAAYTHRVAISNQRIIAFDGERVTFRYRDYHDGNAPKSMELYELGVALVWKFREPPQICVVLRFVEVPLFIHDVVHLGSKNCRDQFDCICVIMPFREQASIRGRHLRWLVGFDLIPDRLTQHLADH